MSSNRLFFPLFFWLCFNLTHSQNKISNGNGNWSNPAIWTPAGVPSSTNNVTISNGHTVVIDATVSVNNLTIGNGGAAAELRFSGNTARSVTVANDVILNTSATFSILSTSNTTHSLFIGGNLLNNGTFRMFQDNNSLCNVTFNKNGNQTISGSGGLTRFNRIILNMGATAANILEVSSTSFTTITNFLTLSNGTFKLSTPNAATVVPFTAATTVQATSGIWLNSPTALMSFSAGLGLNGLLRVTSGYVDLGNANNEDLAPNGGTLTVEGGTLDIAGKYNVSASASSFNFSGGTILISNNASTNTSIAPFHISATGSSFNMSGGVLVLRREGGSGAQDLGYLNTGSTAGSVTGGTIQFGNSTSPANQTISINSTFAIPNMVINSGSVTVKLLTNSLTIANNISILSGTLQSNNLPIAVAGNWSNSGSFVSGTGTVLFNGSSAQSISKSGGETFNTLLFSGTGTKTFSSSITANGNFSVNSNSTVDVSASNFSLALKGNFINSGSFNARAGTVLLNGTTSQSIGGSSTTTFFNLTLNNNSGAVMNSAENIEGTLSLNNGLFNVNSQSLILVSNSSTTARIGPITGTGDISGNVIVQRYAPGGSTGWALFGTPISSALTLNDWDDDMIISCPTCPDGNVPNFLSVYTYDETQPGAHDAAASYVGLSGINDAIVPNKGYWVYLGTGAVTTASMVIDVTGAVRKFNQTIPLTRTNFGSAIDDGWNLIHNPYPSAISWAALKGSTTNIDDAIYVYNADLNSGAGTFATYVNGISSPAVASGGIGDNIPMCQGFYVHSTGATALTAQESNKVAANPSFLKSAALHTTPLLRLNLHGSNSYLDEAVVYFQTGGTKNFEFDHDAYKMASFDPLAPAICISHGGVDFQINGVQPLNGNFSIPVKATTGTSGTFTISANDINTFPLGTCMILFDKATSTTTDLKTSDYVFYLADTTVAPRFELQITLNTLNITSKVNQPTCQLPNQGYITAIGLNQGPWNYIWKNNGIIVKTSINMLFADTLKNLAGGVVELELSTTGLCDNNTSLHNVLSKTPVTAQFSSIDTLVLTESSSDVLFTNTSVNGTSYLWYSGYNNVISTLDSPIFTYNNPGEFDVKLISTNNTGCLDSIQKKIVVMDGLASLKENKESHSFLLKTLEKNRYLIQGNFSENQKTEIRLYDVTGKLLNNYGSAFLNSISLVIDLNEFRQGIYFLYISNGSETKTMKLIVN